MATPSKKPFTPTVEQLKELHFYAAAATAPSRLRTRALRNRSRALIDLAGGEDIRVIAKRYKVGHHTVYDWKNKYQEIGVEFLSQHGPKCTKGRPHEYDPEDVKARVIKAVEENGSRSMTMRRLSSLTNLSYKALRNHIDAYKDLVDIKRVTDAV